MWKWSDLKRIVFGKAADDFSKTIYIMWPAYMPKVMDSQYVKEDLHATVLFIGEMTDGMTFSKETVIEAIRHTLFDRYLWVTVAGIDWFGPEQNIPVMRIEHNELHSYRDSLESELNKRGVPVDQTYPVFKPHVTTTIEAVNDNQVPERLLLGPVQLWWGTEHIKINPYG